MKKEPKTEVKREMTDLLNNCKLATLSTFDGKSPYASLVGFVYITKSNSIIFATPIKGRKYHNLKSTPRAALLISEAAGSDEDFYGACALTVTGPCTEIKSADAISSYAKKFPMLEDFVRSKETAVFRLQPESFYLVHNFQEVSELHIG
ncbi:MAG: hypothetical protein A2020_09650 [Lentisphaerae bacterium GWF2_45_14]|nr:MAG: hypothetical protein A2020_09650 [Lentisphaerae bacterium GWF2_45_14]